MFTFEKLIENLESRKARSAWSRGVNLYALELAEQLEESAAYYGRMPESAAECREWMLNGASDWNQRSWGGSSLCYDQQIAERLCSPYELKKTRNGERKPNAQEEWLDVQARALYQASTIVTQIYTQLSK